MQNIQDESTLKPEVGRQLFDHSTLSTDQHANATQPIFTACALYSKETQLLFLFSIDNFFTPS